MNRGRAGHLLAATFAAGACNGTPITSPAVRLFNADAIVTGDGISGCTHQVPASGNGDRWCAIAKPSLSAPGHTDLWVLDVTRAAAGTIPPCDGTHPACQLMTSNLWTAFPTGGPGHPYSHAFDGDTLIFYADSSTTAAQLHRGPVFAWRPGWPQPRQISSADGLLCVGHRSAAVAYCMDDLVGDPMHPDTFELRAGALDPAATGPLSSLGRVHPFRADGAIAWQAAFSPAGDRFAISSPDPDRATETLRVIATADLGRTAAQEIVRDLTSWTITPDGQTLYFLRDEATGIAGDDILALYTAAFPSGSGPVRIAPAVRDYLVTAPGAAESSVGYLAPGNDPDEVHFRLLRDLTMPASAATIFSTRDELEGVSLSPDGRYTTWRDALLTAQVIRNRDLGACVLNTTPAHHATMPQFSSDTQLVFWTQEASEDDPRQEGFTATPECQGKRRFAEAVDVIIPIGDRGAVYTDAYEDHYFTGRLNVARIVGAGADRALGPPRHVQDGVSAVVTVGTDPLLLLFHKKLGASGTTADVAETGTYLFGPVSF
jgi:hypothetical protein